MYSASAYLAALVLCLGLGPGPLGVTSGNAQEIRIELEHGDRRVRLEFGRGAGAAVGTVGEVTHHLDVDSGTIDGVSVDGGRDMAAGFRVERWYGGPVIAGYGTAFSMLRLDDSLCAEIANVEWMLPFLKTAIDAIALLERAQLLERAIPSAACGPVPFAIFASRGWPMLAGRAGETLFRTTRIEFDHTLSPENAPVNERKQPGSVELPG